MRKLIEHTRLLFFFLCFGVLWTACQEDTIEPETFGSLFGEVLGEDNEPIYNAAVSTNPPTNVVLTDSLGRFAFESIKTNTYTIRAEKEGFVSQIESVTVFEDQAATTIIKLTPDIEFNNSPEAASNPFPSNGSMSQEVNLLLEWVNEDLDGDELVYEVHLFTNDQSENRIVSGLTAPIWEVHDLSFSTTYYWQVITTDEKSSPVNGPVWTFSTEDFPDHRFLYVKETSGKYDIYSGNIAFEEFKLTETGGSNFRPIMSPDRTKIAFISNIGIDPHLFVMNRDGSNIQQVTYSIPISGFDYFELKYAWSPNSSQLLYMNLDKLYRINIDGSGLTEIAQAPFGRTFAEVDWNGNSNQLIARTRGQNSYDSELRIYSESGTFLQTTLPDLPGTTGGAVFSISGDYILYTYDFSEFEASDGRQLDARIFLKNLNTGETIDLSENKPIGTNDLNPKFSPDGANVIFMNTNNDGISPRNIWIMNLEGEGRTMLFQNAEMPDWR